LKKLFAGIGSAIPAGFNAADNGSTNPLDVQVGTRGHCIETPAIRFNMLDRSLAIRYREFHQNQKLFTPQAVAQFVLTFYSLACISANSELRLNS